MHTKTDNDEFEQKQPIRSMEMEKAKRCLEITLLLHVWTGPASGCFWCVRDEMKGPNESSSMDPYKTQSTGSMKDDKNCLKIATLAVWAGLVQGCSLFGIKEGSR
jgi:hypothetical protein